MTSASIAALVGLALCASAVAAPAPWYVWRSQLDGKQTCAQTLQGNWEKIHGPYRDAHCEKRGRPDRSGRAP